MAISLKVSLPFGCDEKEKTYNMEGSCTVEDAVRFIAKDQNLKEVDLRTIYCQTTSKFCLPSATLASYDINDKSSVELCFRYALVPTTCHSGGEFRLKTIAFPLFEPLENWIPYVAHKFNIGTPSDFALKFVKFVSRPEDLNLQESLDSQGFAEGTRLLYYEVGKRLDVTSMRIFHDIQDKQHNRGTKQKSEIDFSEQDLLSSDLDLESPAGTLLISMPKVSGYLSIMDKKKKWDRWFCILIGNHLFYYKSQNDARPTQVLNLVQYKVEHADDKKKKVAHGLIEVSSDSGKEAITHKADTAQWHKQWVEKLQKCCEEARVERDQKIADKENGNSSIGKVFCCPLEDQVEVTDGSQLPSIVEKCIEYIEERALSVEGIFRLSGSAVLIQEYKQKFDAGEDVSFENEVDPHAVAGLFKLYFRELPEPVMTWEHYDDFIIAESIANEGLRLRYLRYLIDNKLPPISSALLRRLMTFLRRVNDHSEVNKMPIHNISTVFGPNLLRMKNANMLQMVEDTAQINNIVNLLIIYDGYLLNDRPLPETIDENEVAGVYARVNYDHTPDTPETDLVLKKGDILNVILQGIDGWWKGEVNGHFGKFPGSFVTILTGEELKKNLRRARFRQEMVRLRQSDVSEDKTLARLQMEREELLATQEELNGQWEALEAVYSVQASRLVDLCGPAKCEAFATALRVLLESSLAYNLVHDDVADCRYDLVNQLEEFKTLCGPDKKKKVDKKQEKVQENIRKLLIPIGEQFSEEQSLHRRNIKLESDVAQTLQAVDQLGYFLSLRKH